MAMPNCIRWLRFLLPLFVVLSLSAFTPPSYPAAPAGDGGPTPQTFCEAVLALNNARIVFALLVVGIGCARLLRNLSWPKAYAFIIGFFIVIIATYLVVPLANEAEYIYWLRSFCYCAMVPFFVRRFHPIVLDVLILGVLALYGGAYVLLSLGVPVTAALRALL